VHHLTADTCRLFAVSSDFHKHGDHALIEKFQNAEEVRERERERETGRRNVVKENLRESGIIRTLKKTLSRLVSPVKNEIGLPRIYGSNI